METNKITKKYVRREYVDTNGWKVVEITGPLSRTLIKTKGDRFICDSNGNIYEGPYDPKLFKGIKDMTSIIGMDDKELDTFINNFSTNLVNDIFKNFGNNDNDDVIDLEETPNGIGTTYKYIPQKKELQLREPGFQGCGCCVFLLFVCVILGAVIWPWLVDVGHAIVQFLINLF